MVFIQCLLPYPIPSDDESEPHYWGREVSIQVAQKFVTAVTDPPLVGCVAWSRQSEHTKGQDA